MSSLLKSLQDRRGENSPTIDDPKAREERRPTLEIRTDAGSRWLLPWSHFVAAEWRQQEKGECLLLSFSHHQVLIEGQRLGRLLDRASDFDLEPIVSIPAKYRDRVPETEGWVGSVRLRCLLGAGEDWSEKG